MLFRSKAKGSDQPDWATSATDAIERFVDGVRDKAVVPLTTVARAVVYGLLASILGVCALSLLGVAIFRVLDIYLHNISWMPEGVWVIYLATGGIFVAIGMYLWSKARTPELRDHER